LKVVKEEKIRKRNERGRCLGALLLARKCVPRLHRLRPIM